MNRLRLKGWRTTSLDKEYLLGFLASVETQPMIKETAIRMITGMGLDDKPWKPNTKTWYRYQARRLMESIILEDPEKFGLERIAPNEITEELSSKELAKFCGVSVNQVYELARGAPENGLPEPLWPLGRTLKGRGYRFPVETAREFVKRLTWGENNN